MVGPLVVTLDVEGVFFKTRISTLKSIEGTFFTRVFDGNWKELLDREGRLFIDRDASVFPVILNFLRDQEKCPLPSDEYQLQRILREAVFFNIGPLRNMIEHKLRISAANSICTCPPELPSTPVPQKENVPHRKPPIMKPPPPPPPPPPPSLIGSTYQEKVQIPMRKTQVERSSKKLKKSADSIGLPQNFQHLAHVGWNGSSILLDKNMKDEETVRKICDAAAEVVDLNAVYNVVNKDSKNKDSESVEVLITGGVMQSREGTSRH